MQVKIKINGFVECKVCHLVFVAEHGFKKQDCYVKHIGEKVILKGICPSCDNEISAEFKLEDIERQMAKTYTLRSMRE
ncbi:hypothetical protein [Campylobacter sp. US33a]|uniref:hypothetical protein n=1 Tax=Campylobacter sp. US33a TaxID=2498120 RepID=UPI0010682CCA|nr:hypothetical protein [Campylobacter sp. US33a]TEY03606.1 hypothetical protein ELQ16_03390 [Campylobacter sp. US33a]